MRGEIDAKSGQIESRCMRRAVKWFIDGPKK
jgi:hypothetical protein